MPNSGVTAEMFNLFMQYLQTTTYLVFWKCLCAPAQAQKYEPVYAST